MRIGSQLLVVSQFFGLGIALWPWQVGLPRLWAMFCIVLAAALFLWTLWHNRPGNFRILPEPKIGGRLVVTGPYRWVRHPMYSTLMLVALGGVLNSLHSLNVLGMAWMVVTLWVKARREERLMAQTHTAYDRYQQTVARFVPGLW